MIGGVSLERGVAGFGSSVEIGSLSEDRGVAPSGILAPGEEVALDATTTHGSIYGFASVELSPRVGVNIAARVTSSVIDLDDRIGVTLEGTHRFDSVHPAIGFTFRLQPRFSVFAGVSRSSRSPIPVELTCADPDDPCRLPNAFVSDPPLDEVVVSTFETGIRGNIAGWGTSAALFLSRNHDDILFVASGLRPGEGHFENVGETARNGVELHGDRRFGQLDARLRYGLVDARFREPFRVPSPAHPLAEQGSIPVERDDRIPGIARHTGSIGIWWEPAGRAALGLDWSAISGRYVRGDRSAATRPSTSSEKCASCAAGL